MELDEQCSDMMGLRINMKLELMDRRHIYERCESRTEVIKVYNDKMDELSLGNTLMHIDHIQTTLLNIRNLLLILLNLILPISLNTYKRGRRVACIYLSLIKW